ncbi:zinc ribbon domain-containing protein [Micromonospora carbonacea]|uniref:zinc ribbon domain-containing protein n=1 Tax=Micromonospora carbonacea TaxID=47853 RepID=UPI003D9E9687
MGSPSGHRAGFHAGRHSNNRRASCCARGGRVPVRCIRTGSGTSPHRSTPAVTRACSVRFRSGDLGSGGVGRNTMIAETVECAYCGQPKSDRVRKCPHCGNG